MWRIVVERVLHAVGHPATRGLLQLTIVAVLLQAGDVALAQQCAGLLRKLFGW